jgi:membrane protein DedA with SNARE-associated domain
MEHLIHEAYALIPRHGVPVLFAAALLSCAGLPIPTSAMMLAAGAFVASGDMGLWPVVAAALVGAVVGDQIGYFAGRFGGEPLWQRFRERPKLRPTMDRAQEELRRRALGAVIVSRFPLSALGPWINLAAGATRVPWARFSLGVMSGDAVWVGIYLVGGAYFADKVAALGTSLTSVLAAVALLGLAMVLGRILWSRHHV